MMDEQCFFSVSEEEARLETRGFHLRLYVKDLTCSLIFSMDPENSDV